MSRWYGLSHSERLQNRWELRCPGHDVPEHPGNTFLYNAVTVTYYASVCSCKASCCKPFAFCSLWNAFVLQTFNFFRTQKYQIPSLIKQRNFFTYRRSYIANRLLSDPRLSFGGDLSTSVLAFCGAFLGRSGPQVTVHGEALCPHINLAASRVYYILRIRILWPWMWVPGAGSMGACAAWCEGWQPSAQERGLHS